MNGTLQWFYRCIPVYLYTSIPVYLYFFKEKDEDNIYVGMALK